MGQRPKGTTVGKRNTGKVKATAGTHSLLGSAHSEPKKKASSRPKASASETSPQPNAKAASSLALAPGLDNFVSHNSALQQTVSRLDQYVSFTIAPKTVSEQSIQAQRGRLSKDNIDLFRPEPDAVQRAIEELKRLGFKNIRPGRFGISAGGPARLVGEVLKTRLIVQARPRRSMVRSTQQFAVSHLPPLPDDLFVVPEATLTIPASFSDQMDDVIFTPPPTYFTVPTATPPAINYFSVDAAAMRRLLNVPPEWNGAGVRVAIVDTGFFHHPYYATNHFDLDPTTTSSAPDPTVDTVGHGTAIAYNVFAIAPAAKVLGFKQTDPPQNALEDAADAGVDIISCSWGWDYEQSFPILEATIHDIVREGKIVLFASGNGEQAWPGSMPDILSVGGVYADQAGALQASNYASGFTSNLYPGRRVPDVSGLCGLKPMAVYIMMPCPTGCDLDNRFAGMFPGGDGTKPDDGWVGASGTSSATPQTAGAIALMVQKARGKQIALNTDRVKQILQSSATGVEKGSNAQGFPAVGNPNAAVGYGLIDVAAALNGV
jgi:serine protease AprX